MPGLPKIMNRKGAYVLGLISGIAGTTALFLFSESRPEWLNYLLKPKPAIVRETSEPAFRRLPGHDGKKFGQESRLEDISAMAPKEEDKAPAEPTGLEDKIGFKYDAVFIGPGAKIITGYQRTDLMYQIFEKPSGSAQEVLDVYDNHPLGTFHGSYTIWFDRNLSVTKIVSQSLGIIVFDRETAKVTYPPSFNEEQARERLENAGNLVRRFKSITGVDEKLRQWDGHSKIPVETYTFAEQPETQ